MGLDLHILTESMEPVSDIKFNIDNKLLIKYIHANSDVEQKSQRFYEDVIMLYNKSRKIDGNFINGLEFSCFNRNLYVEGFIKVSNKDFVISDTASWFLLEEINTASQYIYFNMNTIDADWEELKDTYKNILELKGSIILPFFQNAELMEFNHSLTNSININNLSEGE